MERLGTTHAEIGAYLLGLWGLPPMVTEAVARHYSGRKHDLPWPSVTALYVANSLAEEVEAQQQEDALPPLALDPAYLEHAGVTDQLINWRKLAGDDPTTDSEQRN